MSHPARLFRNTLPDYPSQAGAVGAAQGDAPSAGASSVPREALLDLFRETFDAVQVYKTSSPTIYTGSAGAGFAMWHARRSLLQHCGACAAAAAAAGAAGPTAAAAPAGPAAAGAADRDGAAADAVLGGLPATLLAAALEHTRAAVRALSGPKGYSLTHGSRGGSMLDGGAGVHMTAALVLHDAAAAAAAAPGSGDDAAAAAALLRERDDHVRGFLAAYPLAMDSDSDEYLYGRAGYLQGAQLLNCCLGPETIPPEIVEGVATEMLESGRELAGRLRWVRTDTPRPPLFYMWPGREAGEPYLGAAHGLIGILFSLLHCAPVVQEHAAELRASLAYVASHETDCPGCSPPGSGGHYPTRMTVTPPQAAPPAAAGGGGGGGGGGSSAKALVHWCHGAPGAVFMWCKAYEVFGEPRYLAAAQRAGELVWRMGLLRKGHGLCHGTSGNAYALLALHRATGGQPLWLHRARQFAAHIGSAQGRAVYDTPDRPLSLFEGRGGALCLLADLLADDGGSSGSRFPAFELP